MSSCLNSCLTEVATPGSHRKSVLPAETWNDGAKCAFTRPDPCLREWKPTRKRVIENRGIELGRLIFHAHLGRRHPVGASRTRSADQTKTTVPKLRGSEPVQQQSTAVSPLLSAVQRGSPTLSARERRLARSTPSLCKQGVRGSSPLGSTLGSTLHQYGSRWNTDNSSRIWGSLGLHSAACSPGCGPGGSGDRYRSDPPRFADGGGRGGQGPG